MLELPYDLFANLTLNKRTPSACQRRVRQARIYQAYPELSTQPKLDETKASKSL
jgi:hypothetical protein